MHLTRRVTKRHDREVRRTRGLVTIPGDLSDDRKLGRTIRGMIAYAKKHRNTGGIRLVQIVFGRVTVVVAPDSDDTSILRACNKALNKPGASIVGPYPELVILRMRGFR